MGLAQALRLQRPQRDGCDLSRRRQRRTAPAGQSAWSPRIRREGTIDYLLRAVSSNLFSQPRKISPRPRGGLAVGLAMGLEAVATVRLGPAGGSAREADRRQQAQAVARAPRPASADMPPSCFRSNPRGQILIALHEKHNPQRTVSGTRVTDEEFSAPSIQQSQHEHVLGSAARSCQKQLFFFKTQNVTQQKNS